MQRLNIPLHSRTRATRRLKRRVVWLSFFVIFASFVLLWVFAKVWFTSDTLSVAAPESTVAMLRFTPNQKTWDDLSSLLKNTALISNRGLTINDIQDITQGEFALFFQEDGTYSLAIRSNQSDLPQELLDSQHISVQKISDKIFLFSEKLMPISGLQKSSQNKRLFFHIGNQNIGSAHFVLSEKESISGPILLSDEELIITLPSADIDALDLNTIPENTIAVLSTPVWPNYELFSIANDIGSSIESSDDSSLSELIESFSQEKGVILLANTNKQMSFLISKEASSVTEQLVQTFKTLASLQNPTISTWTLNDGSQVQELSIDPSSIALETLTISGIQTYRYPVNEGAYLYLSQKDDESILSNNEDLLRFWLVKEHEAVEKKIPLDSHYLYLDLDRFSELFTQSNTFRQSSIVYQLQTIFSSLGIEVKKNSLSLIFQRK